MVACRPFVGEYFDPLTNTVYIFQLDFITRTLNVEDGKVGKAWKWFSQYEDALNKKAYVQHEVTKLVMEPAHNIAARRAEQLSEIQQYGCTQGYQAAEAQAAQQLAEQEAKYLRILAEQEERFDKMMRETDGWVLGYNAAWTEAHKMRADEKAAFVNAFIA